jgi:hypothetical protein
MKKPLVISELELANARIAAQGEVIDELIRMLKESSPKMYQLMVTNSKINDWYLIRIGAK